MIHGLRSPGGARRCYPQAHQLGRRGGRLRICLRITPCWTASSSPGARADAGSGGRKDREAVLREIGGFLRTLRDRPHDIVIDFHGLFKSAVFVFLSAGESAGSATTACRREAGFVSTRKSPKIMGKHAVDRYLDFARHLGCAISKPEFPIALQEAHFTCVRELLAAKTVDTTRGFVAVSPVWQETKLWDEAKFAAVCDRIVNEARSAQSSSGRRAFEGPIARIRSLMQAPCASAAGETSLRELAALYKQASVLLTTDSGPMHLAAAVGTPVVALFGPTSPERTGPYGRGAHRHPEGHGLQPLFPEGLRNAGVHEGDQRRGSI